VGEGKMSKREDCGLWALLQGGETGMTWLSFLIRLKQRVTDCLNKKQLGKCGTRMHDSAL